MKYSPIIVYSDDSDLISQAHSKFLAMLNNSYYYNSSEVLFGINIDTSVKSPVFTHLTTEQKKKGMPRVLDRPRAARIHWIGETLDNYLDKDFRIYEKYHGKNVRTYFLAPKHYYILVIETNPRGTFICTGYHLNNQNRVASYMKEYRDYKRKGAPL